MRSLRVLLLSIFLTCYFFIEASGHSDIEPRGKKKKIALFVYFADLVLKKIFIFKLVYAFIFWVVIHKAGYFLSWFVSYIKEKKHDHHDYHEVHVPHYYDHGPPSYGPGLSSYGPYRRKSHGI